MTIYEYNRINNSELEYNAKVYADKGERCRPGDIMFITGIKFLIKESVLISEGLKKIYKLKLRRIIKKTKYNYDDVDFNHISEVERIDAKEITIKGFRWERTMNFDSPEECLKEYIQLQGLWRIANGHKE